MLDIRDIAGAQEEGARHRVTIHRHMHFALPAAFGEPNGLCFPASGRIESTLMHFHMARVDIDGRSVQCWCHALP